MGVRKIIFSERAVLQQHSRPGNTAVTVPGGAPELQGCSTEGHGQGGELRMGWGSWRSFPALTTLKNYCCAPVRWTRGVRGTFCFQTSSTLLVPTGHPAPQHGTTCFTSECLDLAALQPMPGSQPCSSALGTQHQQC